MDLRQRKRVFASNSVKRNLHVIQQSEKTRETGTEETLKPLPGFSYLQFKPRGRDPKNAALTVCMYRIQQTSDISD